MIQAQLHKNTIHIATHILLIWFFVLIRYIEVHDSIFVHIALYPPSG